MPIEIKVTKEIGNYEPKFVGPLTLRQFVTFALAGATAMFLYKTARVYLPKSAATYICAIPAGIAGLLNLKPYGMRPEKFLQAIFVNMFLAPSHRRYRTENTMEERISKMQRAYDELETSNKEANEQHKHGKLLPGISKISQTASKKKSIKAVKKSKAVMKKGYKMSPKAIR